MNKRFSTLLATALVAMGTMSASAAPGSFVLDKAKYYQVRLFSGSNYVSDSRLVILPTANGLNDSLAMVTSGKLDTFEKFNASLWKPVSEKKVNNLGQVYYETKLVNKSGKELSISTDGVAAGQTFSKAKAAYFGAGYSAAVTDANGVVSISDKGEVTYTGAVTAAFTTYDATAKKTYQIGLVIGSNNEIKIMKAETAIQAGSNYDLLSFGLKEISDTYAKNEYPLITKDLNPEAFDAFELEFSNDVNKSDIGNLFTDNKLRAVSFAEMTTTATYTNTFSEAVADAKKAIAKPYADLKAAVKDYTDEATVSVDFAKNTGNTTDAKKAIAALIENTVDLEMYATAVDEASADLIGNDATLKTAAALVKTTLQAIGTIELEKNTKLDASKGEGKTKVDAFNKAVTDLNKLLGDVEKATNTALAVVDSTMQAFMVKPYNTAATTPDLTSVRVKGQLDLLATGGATKNIVFDQYASAIQTKLALVKSEAKNNVDASSVNVLTANAGYYALAIVDSMIDGKQAYLAVDTNYIAKNEKYFGFKADTLTSVGAAADNKVIAAKGKNIYTFMYNMTIDPSNINVADSITINTFMPKAAAVYGPTYDTEKAVVVIRTLAGSHREVSVASDVDQPEYENSSISFKTITLPLAELEKGDVYYIKNLKKAYAKKPYMILTSTTGDQLIASNTAYANVPATQWFVATANKTTGEYTLANREIGDKKYFTNAKLFKYADNTYITSAGDTVVLTKLEAGDAHLGYKFITEEAAKLQTYTLTAKTFANPDAVWYLTMGTDSAVVATQDKEKALTMKVIDRNNYELGDDRLNQDDYFMQVYLGEDTLYFTPKATVITRAGNDATDVDYAIYLTKDSSNVWDDDNFLGLTLRRVNDNAGQYELLADAEGDNLSSVKVGINQNGEAVYVNSFENTNWVFDLTFAQTEDYLKVADAPKNITISLKGDDASMVTAVKPFAVIKRTGLDLKAAATDNDFVLGLDTAFVNRENNFRYAYYITKAIDTEKVGSFDKKAYMVSYADSTSNDKVQYVQDGLTRIGFVRANRIENMSGDSLAIAKFKPVTGKDTIDVAAKKGITNATWAFPIDKDNEGYYRIEVAPAANKADKKYISYLNGVLVLGNKDQAQLFAINDTKLAPTDNEGVSTSSIKVVAGEGNVTIAGAAGKKVVITNVLGQVIANTVLTSDDATVSASAGIVVVAIEGEEAVKAIVK